VLIREQSEHESHLKRPRENCSAATENAGKNGGCAATCPYSQLNDKQRQPQFCKFYFCSFSLD